MRRIFTVLTILIVVFGCVEQNQQIQSTLDAQIENNNISEASVFRNIHYSTDFNDLLLDIYLPTNTTKPYRTIVYVHGGGWRHGSKDNCPYEVFLDRGFAVACIDYRLSGDIKFPAQIQDVKTAIRWLRANSNQYGLDADEIGLFGGSAGGHLAALAGTSNNIAEFETEENQQYSSRVQAVADWFGPVSFVIVENITDTKEDYYEYHEAAEQLFGGPIAENQDMVIKANPITYISSDDPPFLIMHGTKDDIVPISESWLLYDELNEKGINATIVILEGQEHGFGQTELEIVADWFDEILG